MRQQKLTTMFPIHAILSATLITVILFSQQKCLATQINNDSSATFISTISKRTNGNTALLFNPSAVECGSMDIRNDCKYFEKLRNCTVIKGYLLIVLLPSRGSCNFSEYRFPALREITDFLILHEVKNLRNLGEMFPNLTVIRGRKLFMNYALGITSMKQLETLDLGNLISIQRGHVLIGNNPKLCNLDMVNWERLATSPGLNHNSTDKSCTNKTLLCLGCETGYCWSNRKCQLFNNDNIVRPQFGIQNCHAQCLGGCFNGTAQGCVVCRNWTWNGTCVEECPVGTYASAHYLRCYTRDECQQKKNLWIYKNECVDSCPAHYMKNNITKICDKCENCGKICNPLSSEQPFWILNLEGLERASGCHIINGSLFINLRTRINETELMEALKDIEEIRGHLKIYKSPYISSLRFFKKLRKIHGESLESSHYSFILYKNTQLRYLWQVEGDFELIKGGMFIHGNGKLCNRYIKQFKEQVKHDNALDSMQTSDQEVLCEPAKITFDYKVLSKSSIKLIWPKDPTSDQIEIIYRPVLNKDKFSEESDLDTAICERINWQRELLFPNELTWASPKHYQYTVRNLEPHTEYAFVIKTFGQNYIHDARSELKHIRTKMNKPKPPKLNITKKSDNQLDVQLVYDNEADRALVDYYNLEVYDLKDDRDILDQRDFCENPGQTLINYRCEEYDDCCAREEEEIEDRLFLQQIKDEFQCTSEQAEYCVRNISERKPLNRTRLEHGQLSVVINNLERFRLYSIQIQACNHEGCGSFEMLTLRTNYSLVADRLVDFKACKIPNSNEYRLSFLEPKNPNAYITSYVVHFQNTQSNSVDGGGGAAAGIGDQVHVECITRLEHERKLHLYAAKLNHNFNQAAVRVHSLALHTFSKWINITSCDSAYTAKLAGHKGWNIFLIFFLLGAAGTLLWIGYKRRIWRKIPQLRRYLPLNWHYIRTESDTVEDRQILVDGFETVRFQNSQDDDDMKYLVH